jgi:enoyl-CoA hydratase
MIATILNELNAGILTITINRPDKLNALNKQVMDELDRTIYDIYTNDEIKAVIITGSGTKAFVAGADITEFSGLDREQGMAVARKGQDIFFRIENCHKPIVAAVNGFALGGGCELAMACHFRLCSENAKFGQPEINLGMIPGYGGTQRLTHLVGKGKAMEMMMTGDMINADDALKYGLVNYVTTAEELLNKTKEILIKIQSKAPIAIGKLIDCINVAEICDSAFTNGKSGYDKEIESFGDCFASEDMREGLLLFWKNAKLILKENNFYYTNFIELHESFK